MLLLKRAPPPVYFAFAAASPFVSLLGGFLVGLLHGTFCSLATRCALDYDLCELLVVCNFM